MEGEIRRKLMKTPILVILAAGMGSRYGGLKQIDTVGDNGESIIDFSIYDAIQAGFKKLILIIRKEHEQAFEESLVSKIRPFIDVEYAYQDMNDLPEGYSVPEGREKPWGTVHAMLATESLVKDNPFMVINADDYYGKASFVLMHNFLSTEVKDSHYGMVGYVLKNTLTDHGSVTRAICETENGYLKEIVEVQKIEKQNSRVCIEEEGIWQVINGDQIVSMNYWGFTPKVFEEMKVLFKNFLDREYNKNPMKCEYVIPTAVAELIKEKTARIKVYSSNDRWYGVTYQEDKPLVQAAIREFKKQGLYPHDLWKK